jgi:hypothetical protein
MHQNNLYKFFNMSTFLNHLSKKKASFYKATIKMMLNFFTTLKKPYLVFILDVEDDADSATAPLSCIDVK